MAFAPTSSANYPRWLHEEWPGGTEKRGGGLADLLARRPAAGRDLTSSVLDGFYRPSGLLPCVKG